MSMPNYNYMIIFDDGSKEIVSADNIKRCEGDWYTRGVLSVIRLRTRKRPVCGEISKLEEEKEYY